MMKLGKQTIITGDNLTALQAMVAGSVDVIVTSPPYNIGVDYNSHNDRQPRETYLAWLGKRFIELYRVLKPAGSFFLNINGSGTKDDFTLPYAIIERALAAGFVPQNHIVWVKAITVDGVIRGHCKPVSSPAFLTRMHETVLHLTKRGDVQLDKLAIGVPYADKSNIEHRGHAKDLRERGNTWFIDYDTVQSKTGKFGHPAGFPVELPIWCIRLHGVRPNLVVLDPFLGAGTTLVAAQAIGCCGIGAEIDPQYVETTVQRLQVAIGGNLGLPPTHSRVGPSRAALVWHCQGSVQAEDAVGRPEAGEAADRGTELHALAEDLLRGGERPSANTPFEVATYVIEVQRQAAQPGVALQIEQRLKLSAWHPELFGTLDAAVIDYRQGVLAINDFKSGFHHVPANALQLQLYAGMTYVSLPPSEQRLIKRIDTVVVQPNGGSEPIRRSRHRVADILNTLSEYIDRAHVATGSADPPRTAGPWCRQYFCAARNSCPAFRAMTVREAQAEFTKEMIAQD